MPEQEDVEPAAHHHNGKVAPHKDLEDGDDG